MLLSRQVLQRDDESRVITVEVDLDWKYLVTVVTGEKCRIFGFDQQYAAKACEVEEVLKGTKQGFKLIPA